MSVALRKARNRFLARLHRNAPRIICEASTDPLLIFTDASFEPLALEPYCGLGGLLFDSRGKLIDFFSCALEKRQMAALGFGVAKTDNSGKPKLWALTVSLKTLG